MNKIQQLVESSNPWKSMQSEAGKVASKWEKTGLLKNLDSVNKNNMALLLENQAKQLLIEANQVSTNSGFTSGTQGENWMGIALPLVRKVFGQIAAKEFVSVQPMNLPSGLVFFLDFQYGNTKNPFTEGGSLYGNRNASGEFPFATPKTEGGFYGTGRFTFTTNQFSSSISSSVAGFSSGSANYAKVNFDTNYSSSIVNNQIFTITVPSASATLPNFDPRGVRGFVINSGSVYTAANNLQQFSNFNFTNDTIEFVVSGSAPSISSTYVIYYNKETADINRGDFEDGSSYSTPNAASATDIVIPEINVRMQSQSITAKTKKLKAAWTPEFAQDLNAYQNIDAEAELTGIMSEYISMEIDAEILEMLISGTNTVDYWSAVNNTVINNTQTAFEALNSGYFNTQGQWFQTLGTKMQKLSNRIHQLTLRGGANFLVTSPTVATILESIPGFSSNSTGDVTKDSYAFGVQKVGSINNRYTVYKNPYMTENLIFMGYRGSQFLEAGAVFAPYVPLIMTPLVYDPETFTPRKGLLTRFAKKMLRPEFFAKIYVDGLNTI
jgi:hypothetical protein